MSPPEFAVVPAGLLRCGRGLSHGAVKMECWLLGAQGQRAAPPDETADRADWAINAEFWWTHAEAATALGVSTRTTKTWAAELRRAGILIGDEDGYTLDPIGNLPSGQADACDPAWTWWLPLDLTQAEELAPHLWRVWAVLVSYSNAHRLAWPRVDTMARDVGRDRRKVLAALAELEGLGFIQRYRRRRGSTLTRVWTGGGVKETAHGGEGNGTSRVKETAHQGGTKRHPSSMPVVPPSSNHVLSARAAPAAGPYQTHMMLPITGGATGQEQQKEARQGERAGPQCEPAESRDALQVWLAEAEGVLADLGRSPVDQALRGITLRRIADLKERIAA